MPFVSFSICVYMNASNIVYLALCICYHSHHTIHIATVSTSMNAIRLRYSVSVLISISPNHNYSLLKLTFFILWVMPSDFNIINIALNTFNRTGIRACARAHHCMWKGEKERYIVNIFMHIWIKCAVQWWHFDSHSHFHPIYCCCIYQAFSL